MSSLGDLVGTARRKAKMSLPDLAAASGVSARTISYIESGHFPKYVTLIKLARALKMPPDKLMAEAMKDA